MRQTGHLAAIFMAGLLAVAGCAPVAVTPPSTQAPQPTKAAPAPSPDRPTDPRSAARSFVSVLSRMEPSIERECLRRRTRPINCDYQFVVDDRPGLDPNAFQTVDPTGRPVIGFTLSLIAEARNNDELAFVVGHEASHHILNHLDQKSSAAMAGAAILGGLASIYSGSRSSIETAQRLGASVGARYYSKEWELQADYLGAIVAYNAGYDPRNGARFFQRIPDPGNHILGTHPPRAARVAEVERALADIGTGRAR